MKDHEMTESYVTGHTYVWGMNDAINLYFDGSDLLHVKIVKS